MPINRVPKRIWGVVFGTPFWGICDWYLTFSCPKHSPGAPPDRPDSVCVYISLSHCFPRPFFGPGRWTYSSVFTKIVVQKRGLARHTEGKRCISDPPCRGRCTLLKWRLRRAPLVGLFGWWARRSWRLAPVAPPAPAGSFLVLLKNADAFALRFRLV